VTEPLRQRPTPNQPVQRFTRSELAQHWALLVTLTVLALTGLALFAHGTWVGRLLLALEGGLASRGILHRIFAVALMLVVVWHLLYILFTERGHRQFLAMLPHRRDLADLAELLAYYRGRCPEPPAFGRFTPLQKLQYWGAGIGSVMMIATGLVLWFHTKTMALLPKWVIDVTTIVHGYEGLILFMLLFGWHLYIVHLSPGNCPLQRTFLTGTISAERLFQEHRREYEELFGPHEPAEQAQPGGPQ